MEIPKEVTTSEAFKKLSEQYVLSHKVSSFDQLPELAQFIVTFLAAESLLQNALVVVQTARIDCERQLHAA